MKHLVVYPPLPWKVRARLAWEHQVNCVAIWLIDHGHNRAGQWVWQVTGLWES